MCENRRSTLRSLAHSVNKKTLSDAWDVVSAPLLLLWDATFSSARHRTLSDADLVVAVAGKERLHLGGPCHLEPRAHGGTWTGTLQRKTIWRRLSVYAMSTG